MALRLVRRVKPKRSSSYSEGGKICEATHQAAFFRWLSFELPVVRALTFACPNGGSRNLFEAVNLKKQGVTAGLPDVVIFIPNKTYHAFLIEFKFGKNKQTEIQKNKFDLLKEQGYKCAVYYDWEQAKKEVLEYLKDV